MADLSAVLGNVWESFVRLISPAGTLYRLYIVSAAAIAFAVFWIRSYDTHRATIGAFVASCFPRQVYAHPSARLDVAYFILNTILSGVLFAPLLLTSAVVAQATAGALVSRFGVPASPLAGGVWADLGITLAAVVAADFAFFVSHFLQHRIPVLWEFHKVHHAAAVLHPLTAFRVHPVDQFADSTLMGAAVDAVLGVFAYVCDASITGVTILGTNAALFLFNLGGVHLRHSHLQLSYGRVFDRILVSPALHQIHHGHVPEHFGKNLGGILSIWDWTAGSLYRPRDNEHIALGLPEGEHRDYDSLAALYFLPFAKSARRAQRYLRALRS